MYATEKKNVDLLNYIYSCMCNVMFGTIFNYLKSCVEKRMSFQVQFVL